MNRLSNKRSPIKKEVINKSFPPSDLLTVLDSPRSSDTPHLCRRHSIRSISADSSPSSQPPPQKKQMVEYPSHTPLSNKLLHQHSNQGHTLLIQPRGWEYEEGEIWDELEIGIIQHWKRHEQETFDKLFCIKTWTDDFITLGFHSEVLIGFNNVLKHLYQKFGEGIVDCILSGETAGTIAELLLSGYLRGWHKDTVAGQSASLLFNFHFQFTDK